MEMKNIFYNDRNDECRSVRGVHYLGGDMNAKLHGRLQSDKNVLTLTTAAAAAATVLQPQNQNQTPLSEL